MRFSISLVFICLSFVIIGQSVPLDTLIKQYINRSGDRQSNWGEYDLKRYEERLKKVSDISSKLKLIKPESLNLNQQIDYDLFKTVIDDDLNELTWQSYLIQLNGEGGFITGLVYQLNNASVKTDKAKQEYEQKLKDFPKMLFDIQALMDLGKSKGKVSPKVIVEKCISLIEYQLPADIEKSIFYEPVEDENKEYKEKIKKLVTTVVYPAYKNFQSYLKNTYLPAAKDMPGIGHLPQGMKYYENKVKFYTTLDMTPDDVFKKGEEEVARIKAEMTEIVKKLKFEGDFDAFVQFLRKDPQFYANSPQQLLHYAAWLSKSIEEKLPKYFGNLPRNPFTVKEVPSGLAPNYTSGRYSPGSYTRNKAGEYWVNTFNLKSRPLYAMPALTLHEAVPGHHLQGSLAQEITGMSDFRRSTYLSAFGEGWALYTEYLGKEMGIYETPYDDFGRLTYEMWRACRLVIDVGLHYKSWTRDQAIQFMSSNTALSNLEIENEIDRYIGWPGQAISYKTGEIVIRRMRKELEAQLGDKFDLRKFHDVTLKNGAMTLRMLEKVVKGEMATKS